MSARSGNSSARASGALPTGTGSAAPSQPTSPKDFKPSGYVSMAQQKEMAEAKAREAKARKKLKAQEEVQKKQQEALDSEYKRALELSNQRWKDCLKCLKDSVPRLRANPWLIILEPTFIHNYLDSLTEALANLSKHEDELDEVRSVLQDVYEGFVDIGRFAKYQPSFYLSNVHTIKRFVRLLEQVAHRGSDKALFPNVLSLLGPTFEREELYDILYEVRIVHSLMSFVRTDWMPSPATLALLLAIIEQLSSSAKMRELFMEDAGFPKLQQLAYGYIEGFTKDQQLQAQSALSLYPPPKPPTPQLQETNELAPHSQAQEQQIPTMLSPSSAAAAAAAAANSSGLPNIITSPSHASGESNLNSPSGEAH